MLRESSIDWWARQHTLSRSRLLPRYESNVGSGTGEVTHDLDIVVGETERQDARPASPFKGNDFASTDIRPALPSGP